MDISNIVIPNSPHSYGTFATLNNDRALLVSADHYFTSPDGSNFTSTADAVAYAQQVTAGATTALAVVQHPNARAETLEYVLRPIYSRTSDGTIARFGFEKLRFMPQDLTNVDARYGITALVDGPKVQQLPPVPQTA